MCGIHHDAPHCLPNSLPVKYSTMAIAARHPTANTKAIQSVRSKDGMRCLSMARSYIFFDTLSINILADLPTLHSYGWSVSFQIFGVSILTRILCRLHTGIPSTACQSAGRVGNGMRQ